MDPNVNPGSNGHNGKAEDEARTPEHLPKFLSASRQISLAALRERIEAEFIAETVSRPDLVWQTDDSARRDLVRDVIDYVLATETISLSRAERLSILEIVYVDMFHFGPLAPYLADPTLSEFTVDGPDRIYVRHGAQEMTPIASSFDDAAHLERTVQRVLSFAGTQISSDEPVLEVGVTLANRPARLTVFAPPISPTLHVDARLQPPEPATLESCIAAGLLDHSAAELLRAILTAGHGLMIVGDVGTGKTTLLQALIPLLPAKSMVVERAQELRLPPGIERRAAIPPTPQTTPVTFAEAIDSAVDQNPTWLVLDEIRFDEAKAMWRALTTDSAPRCLWAFRGATDPVRIRAAFSMSVLRTQPGIEQEFIHSALLDRLPFVAMLHRHDHQLKLLSVGEWQRDQPDQLESVGLRNIWPDRGVKPFHPLDWTP